MDMNGNIRLLRNGIKNQTRLVEISGGFFLGITSMPVYSAVQCMGKQYSGDHTMLQTIVFLGNCSDSDKEKIARKYCKQIRGEITLHHLEYSESTDLSQFRVGNGYHLVNMVLSEDMQVVSYNRADRKKVSVVDGKFIVE